jgi:alkanesulfonate monooxygenase SsuD/methylene tetrahydromethanopterin reductase-like flavin-dependent oxidoreductase (luciferase family)
MEIGLVINASGGLTFADWERSLDTAGRLGFAGVYASDHFVVGPWADSLEPYLLFVIAARRKDPFRFGPLVTPVTFREPWNLGRWAGQVDVLSGGRFVMGLGVGWHEPEHTAFGIPYPPLKERYARLDEAIQVMRTLWGPGPASFEGAHYRLSEVDSLPKPAAGRPPIMIGGTGERQTLRLVAKYADEWNASSQPLAEYERLSGVLERHCEAAGRDPGTVRRSMMNFGLVGPNEAAIETATQRLMTALAPGGGVSSADFRAQMAARGVLVGGAEQVVDQLGELARLGVEEIIIPWPDLASDELPEFLANDVAPKVRDL